MFSSKSAEWETPDDLFNKLDEVFYFTLDPCATDENHKCDKYFTVKENGLLQDWSGEIVYINPPYGREIINWVKKAFIEHKKGVSIVMLLPSRTDTTWQHDYIFAEAKAICFIRGRLKFQNRLLPSYTQGGKHKISSAPFPSQLVVFANSITQGQIETLNELGKTILL